MNIATIRSLIFKALPVAVTYLVGRGIIDEKIAADIPGAIDALIIVVAFVPTLVRSIRTHKGK
jgi:hypothetical protein